MCGNFTAEPLRSLCRTDEPQKGRNSCLRLRPRSVFGSFSVVLMSCKVNFHVVRSALQNSVCLSIILMLGIMTQQIQRQIKRKIFYLLVNYKQTPSQPPFREYLYSGDICLGPEGVPWIEVPLYGLIEDQLTYIRHKHSWVEFAQKRCLPTDQWIVLPCYWSKWQLNRLARYNTSR